MSGHDEHGIADTQMFAAFADFDEHFDAYLEATGHPDQPLIIPPRKPPWALAAVLTGVLLVIALALLLAAVLG